MSGKLSNWWTQRTASKKRIVNLDSGIELFQWSISFRLMPGLLHILINKLHSCIFERNESTLANKVILFLMLPHFIERQQISLIC